MKKDGQKAAVAKILAAAARMGDHRGVFPASFGCRVKCCADHFCKKRHRSSGNGAVSAFDRQKTVSNTLEGHLDVSGNRAFKHCIL